MENKQYIVYIDESNISTKIGNSVYCGVLVSFIDKNSLSNKIIFIEKKLKIKYLHWVNMNWRSRMKFAEKIINLNFSCKFVVYKNPINNEIALDNFIYKISDDNTINIYKIIIDGKKNNKYIDKIKYKLRIKGVNFNKLIFVDDKSESLVRLADFMAGLIRSYINDKDKNGVYMFNLLKHKIKILN